MENLQDSIAGILDDITALQKGIEALDKSVAEATAQRQEEHADYKTLISQNSAAKELIGLAKNRLNKFYNKAMYKAPAKVELDNMERVGVSHGLNADPTPAPGGIAGTGVTVFVQRLEPTPDVGFEGEYKPHHEESNGVIAMMDMLIRDLDKEITEAKTEEKDSQADYEELLAESKNKRIRDKKALDDKTAALAELRAESLKLKEDNKDTLKELQVVTKIISQLHGECDWLLKNYGTRKSARSGERDSLGSAKAILSGADYA